MHETKDTVFSRRYPAISLLVFCVASCSGEAGRAGLTVRDSAGVRIVESPAPPGPAGWAVTAEPLLSIGQAEGNSDYQFDQVLAAIRLSDGRIVVADNAAPSPVRYYAADGAFLKGVGRRGPGPEEYQRVGQLQRLAGDSVIALDVGDRKAVLLDPAGEPVATASFRQATGPAPSTAFRLADGRWVGYLNSFDVASMQPVGLQRMQATVVLLNESGVVTDTVGVFPGPDVAFVDRRTGIAPFGRNFALAISGDALYIGTGDDVAFDIRDPSGTLVRSVRALGVDLRLTDEDIDRFRERTLASLPNDQARTQIASWLDGVPRLEKKAAYTRMLLDPEGDVWLGPYETPFGAFGPWRVFDHEGRYVGEINVPRQLRVLDIGSDWILGVWQDDLGVETVRLHGLDRQAGKGDGRRRS
jgi:hypothetical protein